MNRVLLSFLLFMIPQEEVVSIRSAEHYRWGGCCDGWYLVKNDRITVIQERMPAGSSETWHMHRKAQQFFYVLKGQATLEFKERVVVLHEGEGALVSMGIAHRIRNSLKQNLLLQVTSEPPSHGDRVEIE